MNKPNNDSKLVALSERWYRRLLILYPRSHRREYGGAMVQLFRDQCRDAWRDARLRGLLLLWMRIVPDLVKTSFVEQMSELKGIYMLRKLFGIPRPSSAALAVFIIVGLVTFMLVAMTATIVTFILPETYASHARVKIEKQTLPGTGDSPVSYDPYLMQSEFEKIQSEAVLDEAIEKLDLNERWQKKYSAPMAFKTPQTRALLRRMIEVRPSRNNMLLDITVYSDDKLEAANIANTIAQTYQHNRQSQHMMTVSNAVEEVQKQMDAEGKKLTPENKNQYFAEVVREVNRRTENGQVSVEIIETAEPGFRPVRPNKPLNVSLGIIIGGVLGMFVGGFCMLLVSRSRSKNRNVPPFPGAAGAV